MWVEFFVLGGIWFYALALLATIAILISLTSDKFFWATIWIVSFLAAIHLLGDAHFMDKALAHPLTTFGYFVGYLGVGVVWSLFKWWLTMRGIRSKYDLLKSDYLLRHKIDSSVIPDSHKEEWRKHVIDNREYKWGYGHDQGQNPAIPMLSRNKDRITGWMVYWPASMVLFFLGDLLVNIYDWLYLTFAKFYQKISDRVFKGIKDDF